MEKLNIKTSKKNLQKTIGQLKLELRHDTMDKEIIKIEDDKIIIDLTIGKDFYDDTYRIYGLIRGEDIYLMRYVYIPSFPDNIDIYDEFYSNGSVIM